MIKKIKLNNFTVFDDLELDFSPKINIIIGENGTGKSNLLKALYSISSSCSLWGANNNSNLKTITNKFIETFLPLDNKLNKLKKNRASEECSLKALFGNDERISLKLKVKNIEIEESLNCDKYNSIPIFIPTKEVLSLIRGITSSDSDQKTIKSMFDDTYLDLCKFLLISSDSITSDKIDFDPRFGTIFPKIVKIIGGKYSFSKGEFLFQQGQYTEKRKDIIIKQEENPEEDIKHITSKTIFEHFKDLDISNNMTAEGFRKIGVLQQLLSNKTLNPGTSGTLFWDEPESNMNPKLMKFLVEVLLELSRNGQQIILATHDYVLLKWFDLLIDKGKGDHVIFHSLYRDKKSLKINANSTSDYLNITPNPIDEAFGYLINQEITNEMGDLGK